MVISEIGFADFSKLVCSLVSDKLK